MMGNITFLMTAVFDPLPLTLDKLPFLIFNVRKILCRFSQLI